MKEETIKRLKEFVNSTDEDIDDIQLDFDDANEILDLQSRYEKLREAFEELNTAHAKSSPFDSIDKEEIKKKWRIKAGIKAE